MQGMLFANNRFEVIGEPEDYRFFALKQSTATTTQGMVFRDNKLISPADYEKAHLLYGNRYTRANVDLTVQWTVTIAAVDPAGKPVGAVFVIARDETGETVAQDITDSEGRAEMVLTDYHLVGNRGDDPLLQRGPYELTFLRNDREVEKKKVDPTETRNVRVAITEPERRLYVYAGGDQRLTTGDVAKLRGTVWVAGDGSAEPEVRWTVVKGVGGPNLATPDDIESQMTFETPKESWLQQAELELTAKLGDQTVSDRVTIRADADITPKAVVTGPKKAKVGTIVQLDGSRSKDPRRFPAEVIQYQWRQTGGPQVNLSSTEWLRPIFFPEQLGVYTFELTVSSPIAISKPISFTIEVTKS
jgi:hypothetical protein